MKVGLYLINNTQDFKDLKKALEKDGHEVSDLTTMTKSASFYSRIRILSSYVEAKKPDVIVTDKSGGFNGELAKYNNVALLTEFKKKDEVKQLDEKQEELKKIEPKNETDLEETKPKKSKKKVEVEDANI